jgi:hypothetical protein
LGVFLIAISGCSQTTPQPGAKTTPETTANVVKPTPQPPGKPVESVANPQQAAVPKTEELVATAASGTAEATFQQTLIAFQDGRFDAAYEFLPESYQNDVAELVHEFADKMDSELWSKSFGLLAKISNILTTKKSLILSLDNVKKSPQIDSIKPHWDSVASAIQEVATSDVSKLDALKRSDVKKLLADFSRLVKGMPFPKFGDVTVKTIKSDEQTATLSYRDSKNAAAKEVEFVKVEGKWLPKSIATGWSTSIANTRAKLSALPGMIGSVKPQAMQTLDEVGQMLDQIQQAKNAGEFNQAIVPLIMAMKFGAVWVEQSLQDATSGRPQGTAVQVVIGRELSDDEETKLIKAIQAAFSDSAIDYELIPTDGKTRCRFSPIPDQDALVAVLKRQFDGAHVQADPATKSILVELK